MDFDDLSDIRIRLLEGYEHIRRSFDLLDHQTPGIKAKGIQHQICEPSHHLGAKPTTYKPSPNSPPNTKRRRQWQ